MSTSALRVVIVGGGIGGAAAANALLQRGIDVRVYEQASALTEVGAGVALQPNGIRVLRRLGFGAEIARYGARWVDPQFYRADGTFIAPMWPPDKASEIEFYGMHRADLLGMLVDRLPAGIIKTGHRCVGFEQDDEQATVIFANGERATADVVVGADGIHSALQPYVVEPSAPVSSGSMAYRGVIPAASVDWPDGAMRNWLGAGKRFMVYPVRAGELLNYVGFVPTDEQMKESWSAAWRSGRSRGRVRRLGPAGRGGPRPGQVLLPLGPLRPRAAADLDPRSPDPAGRCRPPDAPARRAGRQPGDRGWRRARRPSWPRQTARRCPRRCRSTSRCGASGRLASSRCLA